MKKDQEIDTISIRRSNAPPGGRVLVFYSFSAAVVLVILNSIFSTQVLNQLTQSGSEAFAPALFKFSASFSDVNGHSLHDVEDNKRNERLTETSVAIDAEDVRIVPVLKINRKSTITMKNVSSEDATIRKATLIDGMIPDKTAGASSAGKAIELSKNTSYGRPGMPNEDNASLVLDKMANAATSTMKRQDKSSHKPKPLNVLVIYPDDWRHDSIGGVVPVLRTPFLNKLAREGIRFTHNCVTTSICWISRATYFTGQYGSRHKSLRLRNPVFYDSWNESWPDLLRSAGYYTGHIGKWQYNNFKAEFFNYTFNAKG